MQITGAQAIVKVLEEEGVDTVFGYPGGQVIPLYNALYDAPLKNILTVHEQGAVHAADGYARASGKVGVCIATSGPGATNIVTGLATAYLDSIPLVAICGQVATQHIGRDAFQEVDIVSVSLAITKYNMLVTRAEDLIASLREAFCVARSGRNGPVLIDIPSNIQNAMVDWYDAPERVVCEEEAEMAQDDLVLALKLLEEAKRPVLLVGGGAIQADCVPAFRELANKTGLPVVSTLMGLGAFPGDHEQFLGMSGMHGQKAANLAISNADLMLVVGSRFSERVTGDRDKYSLQKKIIQFDIDPSEVGKNVAVALPIMGHLTDSLAVFAGKAGRLEISAWWKQIRNWQAEKCTVEEERLTPPWLMKTISSVFADEDAIFVTDVGQNQMWAAQNLCVRQPRTHLTSGGCGTMGFSMPAALGAKLARPEARIIQIAGDGGFKMTGMELFTAVTEKLPMINIILNNQALGMVKQWQHLFFDKRYSSTILPSFDFVKFARSCGAEAEKTETKAEFLAALARAKQKNAPYLIEVTIPSEEMVDPMVAPGSPINEFVNVGS